jgi:hypothetical protein
MKEKTTIKRTKAEKGPNRDKSQGRSDSLSLYPLAFAEAFHAALQTGKPPKAAKGSRAKKTR